MSADFENWNQDQPRSQTALPDQLRKTIVKVERKRSRARALRRIAFFLLIVGLGALGAWLWFPKP
jgi:hypothetical protein